MPGLIPLYYTSCLFGSVIIHAYYERIAWLHHLYVLLTMLSIVQHAKKFDLYKGKKIVERADTIVAHIVALCLTWNMLSLSLTNSNICHSLTISKTMYKIGFWSSWTAINLIFYVPFIYTNRVKPCIKTVYTYHGLLHIISTIGSHCMIMAQN